MLILTKKMGETIVIDNDIKITILDIKGSKIRIGIEAPDKVNIQYKETSIEPEKNMQELVLIQSNEKKATE